MKLLNNSARDDVARYIRRAQEFPMLEADVEWNLARQWRDHEDDSAAESLANGAEGYNVRPLSAYLAGNETGS